PHGSRSHYVDWRDSVRVRTPRGCRSDDGRTVQFASRHLGTIGAGTVVEGELSFMHWFACIRQGLSAGDLSWIGELTGDYEWKLAPDALRCVSALVTKLRPRHIVEFGSGLSTQVLARSAIGVGLSCAISSIDHDPTFGPLAEREFRRAVGHPNLAVAF